MIGGLTEVGARLVLTGKAAYIAGLGEASSAVEKFQRAQSAASDVERAAAAPASALARARLELGEATNVAKARTVEYEAAVKAEAKAEVEAAKTSQAAREASLRATSAAQVQAAKDADAAAQARLREAQSYRSTASAAKIAADDEVAASERNVAAQRLAADRTEAAQAKQRAAMHATGAAAKTAFLGVAAATGVATYASVKMAGDFEQSTTRLVTSAGEIVGPKGLDLVRQGMLDMAGQVGVSALDLSGAMYVVESASYRGAQGLAVLKAGEEGAKAEGADAKEVVSALTSAMRDYYPAAKSVGEVTDASTEVMSKLVAATSVGKMSFQDLASSLHSVLPAASSARIPLEDVLGALSSMTVHGFTAQQATQNLAHAIGHLQATTGPQRNELALLGISYQQLQEDLGKKGLTGTIAEIDQAIQKHMGPDSTRVILNMRDAMSKLVPAAQELASHVADGTMTWNEYYHAARELDPIAQGQAMSFASLAKSTHGIGSETKTGTEVWQTYASAMKGAMGDQTGMNVALLIGGRNADYTADAVKRIGAAHADSKGQVSGFAEVQKTFNQQLAQTEAKFKSAGIELGTAFLPVMKDLVGVFSSVAGGMSRHIGAAKTLIEVVGILVGLYVTWAAVTKIVVAVQTLWVTVQAILNTALWEMDAAMAANVIGLIVIAIIAMVAALIYAWNHWKQFREVATAALHGIVAAAEWVWNTIKGPAVAVWNFLTMIIKGAVAVIVALFRPLVDGVRVPLSKLRDTVVWIWADIVGFAKTRFGELSSFIRKVLDDIKQYFAPITDFINSHWDEIVTVVRFAWGKIKEETAPLVGFIKWAWGLISSIITFALAIILPVVRIGFQLIWLVIKLAWDAIIGVIKIAWDIIIGILKFARDLIIGIISIFLDIVTGHWSRAWEDIKKLVGNLLNDIFGMIVGVLGDLADWIGNSFTDLWNSMRGIFHGLWDEMKHIFVSGANVVIDVVNGFLKVVNNIAGAIGFSIHLEIPHVPELQAGGVIPVRYLAEGGPLDFFSEVGAGFMTRGPRAIVGEGDPAHPEYVIPTDPRHRGRALGLFQDLAAYLLGSDSAPGYDVGGVIGGAWDGITSGVKAVGGALKSAAEWAGDIASKGIHAVIESTWPVLDVPADSFAAFVPGMVNKVRAKALDWFDTQYVPPAAGQGSAAAPAQVMAWIMQALDLMGMSHAFAPGISTLIMHESGGNPSAINNWDSNARAGHPSQGLMQTIPSTFRAYVLPSLSNRPITDPIANITAGVRYALAQYGSGMLMAGGRRGANGQYIGYEAGGVMPAASLAARLGIPTREIGGAVAAGQAYLVGEKGPEIVVPASPGVVVPNIGGGDADRSSAGQSSNTRIGGSITLGPVYITESGDSRKTYDEVRRALSDAAARM
jgi:TP901 family phage tail tape measure protein